MSPSSNSYTTTHCSPSYMVKSSSLFRDLAQLEACPNFYQALYHVDPAYYLVISANYHVDPAYYLVIPANYHVNNASPPI